MDKSLNNIKPLLKGFGIGLCVNLITTALIISFVTGKYPLEGLKEVMSYRHLICSIMVLGSLPNLFTFLYFIKYHQTNSVAKGILMFTILISIVNLALKFR